MLQERDLRVRAYAQSRVCPCAGAFRGAGLFPTSARLSVQQLPEPIATRCTKVTPSTVSRCPVQSFQDHFQTASASHGHVFGAHALATA